MKVFIVLSAVFACALASGYLESSSGDYGNSGYGNSDYGNSDYGHQKVAIIKTPIYKTSLISKTVKLGESHRSYPVQEARFTRSDYETPGATYAIPAVKTIQVTRPGYTTYIKSSVTKAHVTNHQVRGPTYTKPIYKTVVNKVLVPVKQEYKSYGGSSYESGSNYGGDLGGSNYGGDLGASNYGY